MSYEAKVFADNMKLKQVLANAYRNGDVALEKWAKRQLEIRGVIDGKK